jgi:hypothetical protein
MHREHSLLPAAPQLQLLADARRILQITAELHPFMDAEGRKAIRDAKRVAWATIADAAELLVGTLDAAAGDPDLENATAVEDEGIQPMLRTQDGEPGCPAADPGEYAVPEGVPQDRFNQSLLHEDAEEDDHGGGNVTDEPYDAWTEDGL